MPWIFPREVIERMSSEVFVPSNGSLLIRDNLADGMAPGSSTFRPKSRPRTQEQRPSTQGGGYRFGQLSHNSFFARHNPHPARVRHMKGLLDIPICAVNDDGYFSNPRYSLQFPPNNYNEQKAKLPVNAINVNSQMHPINTITGLQWFMGKPLNNRVFREKAVPNVGLGQHIASPGTYHLLGDKLLQFTVPVTDAWRDELKALTESIGVLPKEEKKKPEGDKPRTAHYSAETGRLIPPPSRAMSRGNSRGNKREQFFNQFQHITEGPDIENMVLQMLCQILQTDDVNAVQSWLVSAGDREKALVLDMIKAALASTEEYYKTNTEGKYMDERPKSKPQDFMPISEEQPVNGQLPAAPEDNLLQKIDRLTLEPSSPRPTSQLSQGGDRAAEETKARPRTPAKPTVRYTFTPTHGDQQRLGTPARMATPLYGRPKPEDNITGKSPLPPIPTEGKGTVREDPNTKADAVAQPPDNQNDMTLPVVNTDTFRPNKSRGGYRPTSGLNRPRSPSKPSTPYNLSSEAKLRYVTTPIRNQDIHSQKYSLNDVLNKQEVTSVWNPHNSTLG